MHHRVKRIMTIEISLPEVTDKVLESLLPGSRGLCPNDSSTQTIVQMKAEIKSKLSIERFVVVIVLTFRTQQSVTSSECFKIHINYSEAEKREGRRRRAEVIRNL